MYSLSIPKKFIRSVSLKLRKTNLRIDRRVKGQLMKRVGLIPSRVRRDGLLASVLVFMERVVAAKLGLR